MTTHRFSRRVMLRGVGVSMALPWLESVRVWGDEAAPASLQAKHQPGLPFCSLATGIIQKSGGQKAAASR